MLVVTGDGVSAQRVTEAAFDGVDAQPWRNVVLSEVPILVGPGESDKRHKQGREPAKRVS